MAWFCYEHEEGKEPLELSLKSSLEKAVKVGERARVYVLQRSEGQTEGKFIFGRRKRAPWMGFGRYQGTEEVGEYLDV